MVAVGGIFLTIGLIIASIGGYFFLRTKDFLKNCLRSPGRVIELRKTPTSRYYRPVVQFETTDNRTITALSKFGSNPPTHKVEDAVTVLYRATSPETITLDHPLQLWFLTFLLGGIGSIFVIVGGTMLIFSRH